MKNGERNGWARNEINENPSALWICWLMSHALTVRQGFLRLAARYVMRCGGESVTGDMGWEFGAERDRSASLRILFHFCFLFQKLIKDKDKKKEEGPTKMSWMPPKFMGRFMGNSFLERTISQKKSQLVQIWYNGFKCANFATIEQNLFQVFKSFYNCANYGLHSIKKCLN